MKPALINWTFSCIDSKNTLTEPPNDLRARVNEIQELPPLPGIAAKIMKLATDPLADAKRLADIVEMDPLLTTQVMRWASSSFYGYKGKISHVQDAISRVLGYQFVFDLVLGLSALSPLKAPTEGVIGIRAFWMHALASTRLMSELNALLPFEQRIESQTVFFVALMHNIGFPVLGDQFEDEFNILSNLIAANPSLSLPKLEKFAFGVDHCELGYWLLKNWNMPAAVVDVVYHHHNPNYRGDNYQLNLLTFLTDSLLASINIGDAHNETEYENIYQELNLNAIEVNGVFEKVESQLEDIKEMVKICMNTTN
ncbi:MAG: HDOD domain-containing protein [Methylococcales bacterium]